MEPKDRALRNKQRERRQRGHDFQEEWRKSWHLAPNIWQLAIKDGGGGTRPADRLILTQHANILAELKRTKGRRFELSFLRPNQLRGLIDFDQVIERNYGLVAVSFHNPEKGLDDCFVIRMVTAVRYMQIKGRGHITLEELQKGANVNGKKIAMRVPRLETSEPLYDVKEVTNCYKYL